jgi:membrane protein YdbS with pleckstrin-like domain
MNDRTERAAAWVYRGVWGVVADWFRVPVEAPTLPVVPGGFVESFKPAPAFLRYMKFWFWIGLLPSDIGIFVGWAAVTVFVPWVGLLVLPVALVLAIAPDVVVYVALHLRYDTTWYVVTDRSLRIRRGIWVIEETTITFENVQNVSITQGPLERAFGIATLVVDTAGGGGEHAKGRGPGGHRGTIEGVTDAERLRRLILQRLNASRSAGLGEDAPTRGPLNPVWDDAHLGVLREIRDELQSSKYKVQSSK